MVIVRDGLRLVIENSLVQELSIENCQTGSTRTLSLFFDDGSSSLGLSFQNNSHQLLQVFTPHPCYCFNCVNTLCLSNMLTDSDYFDSSDDSSDLEVTYYGSRNIREINRTEQECLDTSGNDDEMMIADYSEDEGDDDFNDAFNDADSNSEVDLDDEDDAEEDISTQMTIAIEMEQSSGDDMSASSEEDDHVELDEEEEEEEEDDIDDYRHNPEDDVSSLHVYDMESSSESSDMASPRRRHSFESESSEEFIVAPPVMSTDVTWPIATVFLDASRSPNSDSQVSSTPASPAHSGGDQLSPQVENNQPPQQSGGDQLSPLVLSDHSSPQASSDQSPQLIDNGDHPTSSEMTKPEKGLSEPSSSETQNGDDLNKGICCICLDSPSNQVVVPCGHICLCQRCKEHYVQKERNHKKKCPLCTTHYSMIIKCYN